jgi:hypothetical protein
MQGGFVFDTADPDVVVRVGPMTSFEEEQALQDPDFEGGVVKVYALVVVDDSYVVTWKERVSPGVQWWIRQSLPADKATEILQALAGICWKGNKRWATNIDTLATWDGTLFFARALAHGLPCNDIDIDHNIGVTRDGRIVAFDL